MSTFKSYRVLSILIITAAILAVALLSIPSTVKAPSFPKGVAGYVYDVHGNIIEGATVVVNLWDGSTLKNSMSTTTDYRGIYTVTLSSDKWPPTGYTIEVVATVSGHTASNSAACDESPVQQIDVHYTYDIPEFGAMIGVGVAAIAAGILAVVMIRRKRA